MSRKNNTTINKNTISNNTIHFNTLETSFTKPNYKFYPENEEENHCHYISSRGFLKACDIHSLTPVSSIYDLIGYDFDFNTLEDDTKKESKSNKKPIIYTIYICNSAIPKFADKLKNDKAFKKLKCKFIVVSGDSDDTCPDDLFNMYSNNGNQNDIDFKNFIENDKIIHWYSQNCLKNSTMNNNTNTSINTNTNTNTNANINLPTVALTNSTQTYTLDQIRTIMFVFARVIKATPDMFYMFCTNDTQFEQFLASPIFTSGILQPLANASTNITQSLQNGIDFTVPISMNTIQTELSNTNLTSSFNNIISSNPGSTGSLTQTDSAPLTFGHNGENGDNGDNENNDDVNQTTLTQQDNNNIQELCDLGFDITLVTQTYIMTGKNKELAASMLIDFTG